MDTDGAKRRGAENAEKCRGKISLRLFAASAPLRLVLLSVSIRVHPWLKLSPRDSDWEVRMKAFRTVMLGCLLIVGAFGLSGCAATDQGKAACHGNVSSQAAPVQEQKTTSHKISDYLLWPLEHIFIWGSVLVPPG